MARFYGMSEKKLVLCERVLIQHTKYVHKNWFQYVTDGKMSKCSKKLEYVKSQMTQLSRFFIQ